MKLTTRNVHQLTLSKQTVNFVVRVRAAILNDWRLTLGRLLEKEDVQ